MSDLTIFSLCVAAGIFSQKEKSQLKKTIVFEPEQLYPKKKYPDIGYKV